MTNGARLDRIEKARGDGRVSRKVGSAYACVSVWVPMRPFTKYRGSPTRHLERRGNTPAKILVDEDGECRWAEDFNDPDARYCKDEIEFTSAMINSLCLPSQVGAARFTEDEVQAAFDLIISELKQGIQPKIKW